MISRLLVLALGVSVVSPGIQAGDLPSNLLYDESKPKKTIWPLPVKNSGELKYNEHRQDLSKWPSLSYEDKRPTAKPQKVALAAPLNGDAEKGKGLAMNTQKGNCWACHALPGDAQPGSGGPSFIGFGKLGYDDAYVYQQIWDRRATNPQTIMPPYGTNGVLSEQEIRDIAAFLQSIK